MVALLLTSTLFPIGLPWFYGLQYAIAHPPQHLVHSPSLKLQELPPNTFGRCWLDFMKEQQARVGESQDLFRDFCYQGSLHVLTGYGTDCIGQVELYAFLLGAEGNVVSLITHSIALCSLGSTLIANPCFKENGRTIWSRLHQAYWRGQKSWFDHKSWQPQSLWDLPLPYVQRWFGLGPDAAL